MVRESGVMVKENGADGEGGWADGEDEGVIVWESGDDGEGDKWSTADFDFCRELTFGVVYNVVAMEILHPLQHTPQDVPPVVHY